MKASGALLLRGMRWRLATSVLTVLTSAIAVGAAVLGPLYLWTAGDSVVRTTVTSAPIEDRGATVAALPGQVASLPQIQRGEQTVERMGGSHQFYGTPITSIVSGVSLVGPGPSPLRGQMFWRTGICAVLRFQAGSCNMGSGDVAISGRSARELRVSLGAVIPVAVQGTSAPVRLKVTGIYSVPGVSLSYWWGERAAYFPYGQTTGPDKIPEIDSMITSPGTALAVPVQDVPYVSGQVPLLASRVGLGDEAGLERALSRTGSRLTSDGLSLGTQLLVLLDHARQQRHVMSTIVVIASVQLVLLAIWVLGSLLVRSSDARQSELRVARLRGFPGTSMLAVSAAEPAILCLIGVVLGVAVSWLAVVVARDQLLNHAATISADWWAFASVGATVLAIVGTLGVGTLRVLRASGLSTDTAGKPSTARRLGAVADIVLLVLSLVALIALGTSGTLAGRTDPIASAAPGLIALGTAVVAVELVLFVCRLGVSASVHSNRVATFLALRQIVRRPAVLRQARVLIIALCLACFATSAWWVARSNRAAAASFTVGTTTVAAVTPSGVGLEEAVDRADPGGHFAMAAVAVRTASSNLLAVEARRLPAAMSWPSGISRSSIAATSRALDPPTAAEVILPGGPVRISGSTTATLAAARQERNLELELWLFNPQFGTTVVDAGALHAGAFTYRASLASVCPGGCRLAGLGLVPAPNRRAPTTGAIRLDVSRISTVSRSGVSTVVQADLFTRGWRPTATGIQVQTGAAGGLTFVVPAGAAIAYADASGAAIPPMAAPVDHPTVLPGAVTTELQSLNGPAAAGGLPTQGLDGNTLSVRPAVSVSALPRLGSDAVMVDLDLLGRSQVDPITPDATDQVWLGPDAPRDALARLRAQGLRVDSFQQASAVFAQMQRSGPALADDFLLGAAVVALLVAAASTLGALGATTRERATELTALEVAGIHRPVLARSLAVESGVLAVTALFGAGAGIVAAMMALPSLPELAGSPIPLQYGLPGALVAAVSVAVIGVVLLATAAVAAVLIRRMSPLLLRTAPNDTAG